MRISISDYNGDWAYKQKFQHPREHAGYLTREEIITHYGTLGVDAVEYTHAYWDDTSAAYAKRVAEDAGLPIVCYVFGVDLTQPKPAVRADIEKAKRLLDRTAELGAPLAMITPGIVKPGVSIEEQRNWMVEALRECAEHARGVGVTACLENLDYPPGRPLSGRGEQCRRIVESVSSPGLRLIYDCGATLFADSGALDALRAMQPYVVHVHVKNSRRVTDGERPARYLDSDSGIRYTGTLLNEGEVDIPAVIGELRKIGYDGYILIEYQGVDDPREAATRNVRDLRALLSAHA